ncbi:F-box protein At2g26160-like [Typha latifolia]|uniref:F-box protein At2g26160-like n=1 Tax=Typha latifolia TaxID=4733 RepID=UPI003C2B8B83
MEYSGSSYCRSWSELPGDTIQLISEKTADVADFVRLRAVCSSWRCAAQRPSKMPTQLPWLMLNNDNPRSETRRFLCPASGEEYTLFLPEAVACKISGSSHGWLVLFRLPTGAVSLLNPFTRVQIPLPSLSSFPRKLHYDAADSEEYEGESEDDEEEYERKSEEEGNFYTCRVSLSSSPTMSSDCVVMAIKENSNVFAYCRPGDDAWTFVQTTLHYNIWSITYKDGRFYVMDFQGSGEVRYAAHPFTLIGEIQRCPFGSIPSVSFGLIESCCILSSDPNNTELVMVVHTEKLGRRSGFQSFNAFLLGLPVPDPATKQTGMRLRGWRENESLSEHALFWAGGQFLTMDASRFAGIINGNCVYYPVYENARYYVKQFKPNEKTSCRTAPPPPREGVYFNQLPMWIAPTLC